MSKVSPEVPNLDTAYNVSPTPPNLNRIEIKIEEVNDNESVSWTHHSTLTLIDSYGKHRKQVGSFQIKSMKKLWEVLSVEVNQQHNTNFSSANCENRWRVVERNYKKYLDNNNATGKGRKAFEYAEEMDRVSGNKRNIHPVILLCTNTIAAGPTTRQKVDAIPVQTTSSNGGSTLRSFMKGIEDTEATIPATSEAKKRKRTDIQSDTLELMRQEKKHFYKEILELQRERLKIDKEKMLARCKRNELISERNELLKQFLQNGVNLPNSLL